jgi:hypothetical protein
LVVPVREMEPADITPAVSSVKLNEQKSVVRINKFS